MYKYCFFDIGDDDLKDNPLNISTTTGNEGGIDISYNPYLNEIMFGLVITILV